MTLRPFLQDWYGQACRQKHIFSQNANCTLMHFPATEECYHQSLYLTTHPREIQLILTHFQYIPKNDLHRICSVINSEPITCPICWNWMHIYKILQFFLIVYIQPWLGILVVSLTLVNHILYLTFYQIKLNGITDTFIHFVKACFYRKGGEWEGGGGKWGGGTIPKQISALQFSFACSS